jgi:hypothetical protein
MTNGKSLKTWAIGEEEEAMIVGTFQQGNNGSWQEASILWLELDGEEESEAYCVGTCQGASSQPPETGGKCSSGASGSPEEEEEDEEIMKDGWWTPDLKELQIEEGEKEYFIELHMSGSALGGGVVASERPPAASSMTGRPAKNGVASVPEARNSEKAWESKPDTSKGKGRSSKGAPRGKSEPDIKTGKKEAGARCGEELKGWWPSGRGQEVPPNPPGDPGPRDKACCKQEEGVEVGTSAQVTTTS